MSQERLQVNSLEAKETELKTLFGKLFTELYPQSELPRIDIITPQMVLQLKDELQLKIIKGLEYIKDGLPIPEKVQRNIDLLVDCKSITEGVIRDNSYTFFTYEPVTVQLSNLQRGLCGMNNHFYPNGEIAPGIMKLRNCKNDGEISMKDNDWCGDLNNLIISRLFPSEYRQPIQIEIDSKTNFFYNYTLAREAFYTQLLLEKFNAPVFQENNFSDQELFEFWQLSEDGSESCISIPEYEDGFQKLVDPNIEFLTSLSSTNRKILEVTYSIYLFTRNKYRYNAGQIYYLHLDAEGNFDDANRLYYRLNDILKECEEASLNNVLDLKEFIHLVKAANDLTMLNWEESVTAAGQRRGQEFTIPDKLVYDTSHNYDQLETPSEACIRLFKPYSIDNVNTLLNYFEDELKKITNTVRRIPYQEKTRKQEANAKKVELLKKIVEDLEVLKKSFENYPSPRYFADSSITYYKILQAYKRETGEAWDKELPSWPNKMSELRHETFYGKKQELTNENIQRLLQKLKAEIKKVESDRNAEQDIYDSLLEQAVTYLRSCGIYDIISRRANAFQLLNLFFRGISDQQTYDENKLLNDFSYPRAYQIREDSLTGQTEVNENGTISDFISDSKDALEGLESQLRFLRSDLEKLLMFRNSIKKSEHGNMNKEYMQLSINSIASHLRE
jgi:hypothetical protein